MDQNTLERWEKIKAFRNCPKILEDLQEIKYNKSNEWEVLVNLSTKSIKPEIIEKMEWLINYYNSSCVKNGLRQKITILKVLV